ncbi:MAG: zinc ribbon domain-containing protein [Actinobacteria bacterium]|nr:zinc ribbon domain-containing protein [Actinomycetota bacterium]MBU1944846.1 zinc ribbon domain-containing protein [Actinomycetota bacterium]MBU2687087.1 zinc ribbon domain-containing protein [Actinomycetota bacterium]
MVEEATAAVKACWNCGAVNPVGANYCAGCGAPASTPMPVDPSPARARKAFNIYLAVAIASLVASMGGNIAIQSIASEGDSTASVAKVVFIITGVCFLAYLVVLANLAEKAAFSVKNWVLAGLLSPFTLFSFLYTFVVARKRMRLMAEKPVTYYRAPLGPSDSYWTGLSAKQASCIDITIEFESTRAYRYSTKKRMKMLARALKLDSRNHLARYFLAYEYSLAGGTEDAESEISEAYHLMPVPIYQQLKESLRPAPVVQPAPGE